LHLCHHPPEHLSEAKYPLCAAALLLSVPFCYHKPRQQRRAREVERILHSELCSSL
jgi:hypothetical protein